MYPYSDPTKGNRGIKNPLQALPGKLGSWNKLEYI
jgi:hypothetical protein